MARRSATRSISGTSTVLVGRPTSTHFQPGICLAGSSPLSAHSRPGIRTCSAMRALALIWGVSASSSSAIAPARLSCSSRMRTASSASKRAFSSVACFCRPRSSRLSYLPRRWSSSARSLALPIIASIRSFSSCFAVFGFASASSRFRSASASASDCLRSRASSSSRSIVSLRSAASCCASSGDMPCTTPSRNVFATSFSFLSSSTSAFSSRIIFSSGDSCFGSALSRLSRIRRAFMMARKRRMSACSTVAAACAFRCRHCCAAAAARIVSRMLARQPLAKRSSWASPAPASSCSRITTPISCISSTYSRSVHVFCTAPSAYTSVSQSSEKRCGSSRSKQPHSFRTPLVSTEFGSTASDARLPMRSSVVW